MSAKVSLISAGDSQSSGESPSPIASPAMSTSATSIPAVATPVCTDVDVGISILVDTMVTSPKDVELQLQIVMSLLRLSTVKENHKLLGYSYAIHASVMAMRTYPLHPYLPRCVCMFLANVSFNNSGNRERIQDCRGLETVYRLMAYLDEDEELQTWGCLMFRNVTTNSKPFQEFVGEMGFLVILRRALNRYPENRNLQVQGIATIANVASGGLQCQWLIRDSGCVDAVVNVMRRYSNVRKIQMHCLAAIRNMCDDNPRNQVVVRELGAIEMMMNLISNYGDSIMVVDVFRTFRYLCFDCGTREVLGKNGAIVIMLESLEMVSTDMGEDGIESILKALSNATYSPDENKQILIRCNGIEMLMKILDRYRDVYKVIDAGLRVFRNISDKGGVNCQLLGDGGVFAFALDRIQVFPDEPSILEHYLAMVINCMENCYNENLLGMSMASMRSYAEEKMVVFCDNIDVRKLGIAMEGLFNSHERTMQENAKKKNTVKRKSMFQRLKAIAS